MKIHHLLLILLLGLLPCFAEEDHEEEPKFEFTDEEVQVFLKKELPVALELLEIIREQEGEEEHEEVFERAREEVHEYHSLKHYDGAKVANQFLNMVRSDLELEKLLFEFWDRDYEGEERQEMRKRIRAKLTEQQELRKKSLRMEIELMEREVRELKDELEEMEKSGNEVIEEELGELFDEETDDEEPEDD